MKGPNRQFGLWILAVMLCAKAVLLWLGLTEDAITVGKTLKKEVLGITILFGVEGLGVRRLSSSVQPQCMRHAFDHVGNTLTLASQDTADTLLDC